MKICAARASCSRTAKRVEISTHAHAQAAHGQESGSKVVGRCIRAAWEGPAAEASMKGPEKAERRLQLLLACLWLLPLSIFHHPWEPRFNPTPWTRTGRFLSLGRDTRKQKEIGDKSRRHGLSKQTRLARRTLTIALSDVCTFASS